MRTTRQADIEFVDLTWPSNSSYSLPPTSASAGTARILVRRELAECAPAVIEVAELLVSELVSNAISHGSSSPLMRIEVDSSGILVAVEDQSPEIPQLREESENDGGGRGLILVDALALAWGWSRTSEGKRVWFTL